MNFADLIKVITGTPGYIYRTGIRGDEKVGNAGAQGEQEIFRTKKGETYAADEYGRVVPMSPLGKASPTPAPQVLGVNAVQAPAATPAPAVQGLTFDQLLEGYGRYGATPSAQAVRLMAEAQDKYPVFKKNPALLPAMAIVETGAGKYMTRPRGENPQNLLNWGIYTDFIPRDQAHSVERAMSGIGERSPYYKKFRETNNLEDFANTYAPASDGNEGYLQKLQKAMQYFGDY